MLQATQVHTGSLQVQLLAGRKKSTSFLQRRSYAESYKSCLVSAFLFCSQYTDILFTKLFSRTFDGMWKQQNIPRGTDDMMMIYHGK